MTIEESAWDGWKLEIQESLNERQNNKTKLVELV